MDSWFAVDLEEQTTPLVIVNIYWKLIYKLSPNG